MNLDDCFLRDVLESPADDRPRLVYADWLDENGPYRWWCPQCNEQVGGTGLCPRCLATCYSRQVPDPERAEFVRVQCELARLDEQLKEDGFHGPGSMVILTPPVEARLNRQEKVSKRERELFDRFKCQWFDERMAVYHLHTADAEESPLESLTHAVVRRGFVESVTLTTAAFVGGPCECVNWARIGRIGESQKVGHPNCPDCGGSGTRPGVAEAIFRAHPVTSVVLSDRRPLHMSGNYYWFNAADADASGYHPQSDVPKVLYSLLAENDRWVQGYSTAQTARAALSAACVAYGREKAGLEAVCV